LTKQQQRRNMYHESAAAAAAAVKQQQASSSLCEQAVSRVTRSKQCQQLLRLCVFV
jgi:hypothetical protein